MSLNPTSEQIEAIDPNDFEIVVAQYLRITKPELSSLIATGINKSGKPIPYPVDNILALPGNPPPTCIAVATTTISRDKLRGKWMGNSSGKGDISSAVSEFADWRQNDPNIECVLYLATNRLLDRDKNLYRDAIEFANTLGISCEVIEQSALTSFLDFNSEGQYLRQHFFDIPIERLSESLLRQLALHSLRNHHTETESIPAPIVIKRDAEDSLLRLIVNNESRLIGIRGNSGTGKSTIAQQLGRRLNETVRLAMWIPAEIVAKEYTFPGALVATLKTFLQVSDFVTGREVLTLISQLPSSLTIIVDDVNRLQNPLIAIKRLESWSNSNVNSTEKTGATQFLGNVNFVVPLWVNLLGEEQSKIWNISDIQQFSNNERRDLAATNEFNDRAFQRRIFDVLNGDPFLCTLVLNQIEPFSVLTVQSLLRNEFENFIRHFAIETASQDNRIRCTVEELISALMNLVNHMLMYDEPEPLRSEYYRVTDSRNIELLHLWSEHKGIGWIVDTAEGERWHWRHKRIRDILIGRYLKETYLEDRNNISERSLSNSGLAEAWAMSVVYIENTEMQMDLLELLSKYQPLALTVLLHFGLLDAESEQKIFVIQQLRQYVESSNKRDDQLVNSTILWEMFQLMALTDDSSLLEITQKLRQNPIVAAIRLRNGDVMAGIKLIDSQRSDDFLPSMRWDMLEQSIESFGNKQVNRMEVVDLFQNLFRTDTYRNGVLVFAGYLGWSEFCQPLSILWSELITENKLSYLIAFIWMISRCGSKEVQHFLDEALTQVSQLINKGEDELREANKDYFFSLEHTFMRWDITESSADTWATKATQEPDSTLQRDLFYVMRVINHPVTIEAFIQWCAERGHGFIGDSGISVNPRSQNDFARTPIAVTSTTRNHLWHLVETSNDDKVRQFSFGYWRYQAQQEELDKLRSIRHNDILFESVLDVRLRLRDASAINLLVEHIDKDISNFFGHLSLFIEQRSIFNIFIEKLEIGLTSVWGADAVIQYLPDWGIHELVDQKQQVLRNYPRTWYYLWRTSDPNALLFVQGAIRHASQDEIKHFFTRGGFPIPVTKQMLDALIPVLDRFAHDQQQRLARIAARAGYEFWVKDNLLEAVLADKRMVNWITTDDIKMTLNQAVELVKINPNIRDMYDIDGFWSLLRDDNVYGADHIKVIKQWLDKSPSGNQMIVAALVLIQRGTGNDTRWWNSLKPTHGQAVKPWEYAQFSLERHRWQG